MKRVLNIWVVGAGLLIALLLIAVFWVAVIYLRAPLPGAGPQSVAVTVIPAPTLTLVVIIPTPSPTPTDAPQFIPPPNTGISVGSHVQIVGTGGDGLRLRSDPGTAGNIKFLGLDSEVFLVKEGPVEKDGFTWWFLTAPVDATKGGWAVSNYLSVIQVP
jgi:hypothetical protein